MELGVPSDRLILATRSRTTQENPRCWAALRTSALAMKEVVGRLATWARSRL